MADIMIIMTILIKSYPACLVYGDYRLQPLRTTKSLDKVYGRAYRDPKVHDFELEQYGSNTEGRFRGCCTKSSLIPITTQASRPEFACRSQWVSFPWQVSITTLSGRVDEDHGDEDENEIKLPPLQPRRQG